MNYVTITNSFIFIAKYLTHKKKKETGLPVLCCRFLAAQWWSCGSECVTRTRTVTLVLCWLHIIRLMPSNPLIQLLFIMYRLCFPPLGSKLFLAKVPKQLTLHYKLIVTTILIYYNFFAISCRVTKMPVYSTTKKSYISSIIIVLNFNCKKLTE